MKILVAFDVNEIEIILINITSRYNHFFSHHIPTSHFYPNIQCMIYIIYTDSHINIACNIATKKIMSHLNVISLYYKYKQNYMGPLFTIYKLKEIIEIARIKKPFSCAY